MSSSADSDALSRGYGIAALAQGPTDLQLSGSDPRFTTAALTAGFADTLHIDHRLCCPILQQRPSTDRPFWRGTIGSNLIFSSVESGANPIDVASHRTPRSRCSHGRSEGAHILDRCHQFRFERAFLRHDDAGKESTKEGVDPDRLGQETRGQQYHEDGRQFRARNPRRSGLIRSRGRRGAQDPVATSMYWRAYEAIPTSGAASASRDIWANSSSRRSGITGGDS